MTAWGDNTGSAYGQWGRDSVHRDTRAEVKKYLAMTQWKVKPNDSAAGRRGEESAFVLALINWTHCLYFSRAGIREGDTHMTLMNN